MQIPEPLSRQIHWNLLVAAGNSGLCDGTFEFWRAATWWFSYYEVRWDTVGWVFSVSNTWHPLVLGAERAQGDTMWYVSHLTCVAVEIKQSHRKPRPSTPWDKCLQSTMGLLPLAVLQARGLCHQALNFYQKSPGQHFPNCLLSITSMPCNVIKYSPTNIQN